MGPLNLSFSACGFLGIYQLGAVGAIVHHGDRLMASLRACAGASAGALVAAMLITAPDKLEHCKDFTYKFASEVRRQKLGALTPGYDFMLALRCASDALVQRGTNSADSECGKRLSIDWHLTGHLIVIILSMVAFVGVILVLAGVYQTHCKKKKRTNTYIPALPLETKVFCTNFKNLPQ